jgi:predicted metal-binding protein
MDRDRPTEDADDLCLTEASPHATAAEVLISVCTTCRSADGGAGIGPALFDALAAAISDRTVAVRRVQCLGVCKRPATVAVSSAAGYMFLFGDLEVDSGTAALASFVQYYRDASYGLVPWRERAEVLRKGMIARLPPASWSPDDGRAPT